jgi:hypothetical protein
MKRMVGIAHDKATATHPGPVVPDGMSATEAAQAALAAQGAGQLDSVTLSWKGSGSMAVSGGSPWMRTEDTSP